MAAVRVKVGRHAIDRVPDHLAAAIGARAREGGTSLRCMTERGRRVAEAAVDVREV